MFTLLMLPTIHVTTLTHRLHRTYAPSNALIRHLRRSRPTLRAAVLPAMLALVCVTIGHVVWLAIEAGAPEWLNLIGVVLAWDAIKFAWLACASVAWAEFR